jgi:adenylate cyclase
MCPSSRLPRQPLPGRRATGYRADARATAPNTLDDPARPRPRYVAQGTRIDVNEQARQIGTQIAAVDKGFQPFERIVERPGQLRADYERLRLSYELSREIAAERDTTQAAREDPHERLQVHPRRPRRHLPPRRAHGRAAPRAMQRRDGTTAPISVSSTILNHVVKERAAVLTHDAAMDFAASKGKSMILNRISSAIVAPLLHDSDVLGVLWLDSETLAQFQPKDLELVTAIANQAAMFIEINILGKKIENEIVTRERFSRLLSPNVAERVISGELEVKPGGQRVEQCTVFNSDIRGFTRDERGPASRAARRDAQRVLRADGRHDLQVRRHPRQVHGRRHHGPLGRARGAPRTTRCAACRARWRWARCSALSTASAWSANQAPLAVGIGIHTGPLVAGYIGSSKALSYTVIGDVANTSARLCSIALAGQIVVSEARTAASAGASTCEELPPAKVKGKEKPLRIYNVVRRAALVDVPEEVVSESTSAAY